MTLDIEFNFDITKDIWNSLPIKTHDGNLGDPSRFNSRKLLHECVKYFKPKKCVEFGFNVGHSALITIDAAGLDIEFHAFDLIKTTSDLFEETFPNFFFYQGDSVDTFSKTNIDNIDFVFIDSRHTYEHVSNEIDIIFDKINSGGILFFDDMNRLEVHNAVIKSKHFPRLYELTKWVNDYFMVSSFFQAYEGWTWKTINRIYKKVN